MAEKNEAVEEKAAKAPAKKAASSAAAAEKKPAAKKAPAKAAADAKASTGEAAKKPAAKKAAPKAEAEASRPGVLKVHHLRPVPGANTAKTRVGRGEASKGKTAGRGTKGTKARYQVSAAFEGGQTPLHMRLPKMKGFKSPFREEYQVVNLDRLSELFPEGGQVDVETLVAYGAVRKGRPVKILGGGEISVAVQVTADKFSSSAKEKIEAAGGSVTER